MLDAPFFYIPNFSPDYFALQNDRRFETLIYAIFTNEIKLGEFKGIFDSADLKPIGADKGIDVDLYKYGTKYGGIQCKWVKHTLSKKEVAEELIKFALHYHLDSKSFVEISSYSYFLVALAGFSKDTRSLIEDFGDRILQENDLEKWTEGVINKYKTFQKAGLRFSNCKKVLEGILSKIKIEPKVANDIDIYLAKLHNQEVFNTFWAVRTQTDNNYLDKKLEILTQDVIQEFQKTIPQSIRSQESVLQDFQVASSFVAELSNEFIGVPDSHIERSETQSIINWINVELEEKKKNILLLEGGAGTGKSVIMRDTLYELSRKNTPCISIKSDRYSPKNIKLY